MSETKQAEQVPYKTVVGDGVRVTEAAANTVKLAWGQEDKFKPGNAVMLASGGPSMTVLDVGKNTGAVFTARLDIETGATIYDQFPAGVLAYAENRSNFADQRHWPSPAQSS